MSHNHTHTTRTQGRIKRAALAASLSVLLLSLAACGGGSDSPAASASSATSQPSNQPVLDVPAPTYAPDSPEMAAYTLLNEERARCGFGRLAQDTHLDLAARMHGLYLQANQTLGHDEDPTKPAFYAATPGERAKKAGYGGYASENVAGAKTAEYQKLTPLASIIFFVTRPRLIYKNTQRMTKSRAIRNLPYRPRIS